MFSCEQSAGVDAVSSQSSQSHTALIDNTSLKATNSLTTATLIMTRRRSSLARQRAAEVARTEATAAADAVDATCTDADDGGLIAEASGAPVEPSPAATTSSQLAAAPADVSSAPAQPAALSSAIPAAFINRQASQTRANGKTAAMSKQRLYRTSLVEKMTASAVALRKASIASSAFHRTKKQQTTLSTTIQSVEDDAPVSGFDLASLLKEADSNMATADAVITAPTTPVRAAVVDGTLSTQSSSASNIITTTSTAVVFAATTAAAIDTMLVSDEQRLLEGSRVRLPRSPTSAYTTNATSDSILSDNEDDAPKSMPTLHQSFGDSDAFLATLHNSTSTAATAELLPAASYSAGHRHPITHTVASATTATSGRTVAVDGISTVSKQVTLSNSNILHECCGSITALLTFVPIVTAVVASIVVLDVGM
jgi:hypothetical protein